MKRIPIFVLMIFCLVNNASGEESGARISVHGESMENGTASSIAIAGGSDIIYGGISLNHIQSSKVIQYGNRKEIYPIYVFFGFQAPWRIAPYIEAGFDLGDSLINDLYGNQDDDTDLVDHYYAGGLIYSVTDTLSFSVYAKKYKFEFREFYSAPTEKVRPESHGIGVSFRF